MTTTTVESPARAGRFALFLAGLVGIGFGVAVLVWPTKAIVALTAVIAVYAIIAGIVYAAVGLFSGSLGAGGRLGHILLGVLYVVAGFFAFGSLQQSAAFLALFVTVMVGVLWVIEGFTALFTVGRSGSVLLNILFAIVSVVAGVTLLSSPLWGAVFLWWFLGIAMVVLGALNVIRSITSRSV